MAHWKRVYHKTLINFMRYNNPSSNWESAEIETINLLNLLILMGKLTRV